MTSLSDTLRKAAPTPQTRTAAGRQERPAVLIFNPNAGAKLGVSTNAGDADAVRSALDLAVVPYEAWPTERAGHATELARKAVAEGRDLVIAAGGDGTVGEVAQALVGTEATLGVMPLGSVMNVARTLHIPRDLDAAARVIAAGETVVMDVGKTTGPTGDLYFLEAAGVGLDAGLFRYFNRLERGAPKAPVLRAAWNFLRGLGLPLLVLEIDGVSRRVRAPMVTIANAPFVGAAYAIAPEARIDDGWLDVIIFRRLSVLHVLAYLVLVAGGRPFPRPRGTESVRAKQVAVKSRSRRVVPAHADGELIGRTPVDFQVVPNALRVIVGQPEQDEKPAWEVLSGGP